MNKNFLQKKYFLNLFFAALIFALALFIIFFPCRIIVEDAKTLFSLKEGLALAGKKEASVKNFDKDLEIYSESIKNIENVFIDAKMPVDFLDLLDQISQSSGFDIKISPTVVPVSAKQSWPSMIFHVSGKGETKNFLMFLEKIENTSYLAEITDMNLKPAAAGIEANLNLKILSKK